MKTKTKRLTPLEKLYRERNELRIKYEEERTHLISDWEFIQDHAGSLILSGISRLFYPHYHKRTDEEGRKESVWQNIQDNLPFYLAIAREGLSILWYISRPFYIKWNLSRKKKNSSC